MNEVIRAAAHLQAVCEAEHWRFCFIGGLAVNRATVFTFPPDVPLRTCSAEDLLVFKAFADRPKDWVDVDGIILRQTRTIDWDYVRLQLAPLVELKEAPAILEQLERRRVDLDP